MMACRIREGDELAWLAFGMENSGPTVRYVGYGYSADGLGCRIGGDNGGEARSNHFRTEVAAFENFNAKGRGLLRAVRESDELIYGGKAWRGQPPTLARRFAILDVPRGAVFLGAPKSAGDAMESTGEVSF